MRELLVMSAPPISSPLTKTCGIVGQPEISDSSWRIAGSARHVDAGHGRAGLDAGRAGTRSELPHMTNCGALPETAKGSLAHGLVRWRQLGHSLPFALIRRS